MFLVTRSFPRKPDKKWTNKWKHRGINLPKASEFLDTAYTVFVQSAYQRTLYPKYNILREIVKKYGGSFICEEPRGKNEFDTLCIPFWFGRIIIQRPWIDVQQTNWVGYQVFFTSAVLPDFIRNSLEASAIRLLFRLFEQERHISKDLFIAYCKKVTGTSKLPNQTTKRINRYFDFKAPRP